MITYFKNQLDMTISLNKYIDKYWEMELSEPELVIYLKQVYENNYDKILKENKISPVFKQKLGKKRLEVVIKILNLKGI